ncbi:DUF2946 domain-containing protein [Massilia yuzhufengensis]|nr:DUF2946 domain-containing protein [Massilia yuzhufengensis]
MPRSSSRQVLRAWIALVAFVFSLFAPSLSHAFAPQAFTMQSEICTAAGMVMLPVADNPGQDAGAVPGMTHCDVCCSHQAPVLLPPPPALPLLLVRARDTYPTLFYQSPSPQFAWTPAQSRAPPASFV